MFLKCGQKNNTKYIFGLRKEQIEAIEDVKEVKVAMKSCSICGGSCGAKSKFCSLCGARV